MKNKILVEIYDIYGEHDAYTLNESYVANDSIDLRKELVEEWSCDDTDQDDIAKFINGTQSHFYTSNFYTEIYDDEPNGFKIILTSYADKLHEIEQKCQDDIAKLKAKFNIE